MAKRLVQESFKWRPELTVAKYSPETVRAVQNDILGGVEPTGADFERLGISPDDFAYASGNILVTSGVTRIAQLITGTGVAFTSAQGYAGVGNSTTAAAAGQTDLVGTSKYYVPLSSGPTLSGGTFSITANYGTAVANFAWNEWCFGIATTTNAAGTSAPSGVMLNRKQQELGTKASGATWTLSASVSILAGP